MGTHKAQHTGEHVRVAHALAITDASAPGVLGLSPRQFRRFVREHNIPSVRAGRRTLVRADVLLEALDRLAGVPSSVEPWTEADLIAAAVGRR